MPCSRRAAALLAAALALAGCGEAPGPFAHAPGERSALAAPVPDSGGVIVRDVEGPPGPVARALQEAMVEALARYDIPAATTGGNRRSRFLQGTARAQPGTPGTVRLDIAWDLTDTAGKPVGSQPMTREVPRARWQRGDPALIKSLAADAAPEIALLIQDPARAAAAERPRLTLHVWPVAGVDGNDALALRRAMEAALKRREYPVEAELGDRSLVIAGSVALGKPEDGQRRIEVVWTVLDSAGRELGRLAQDNTIPAGPEGAALIEMAHDIAEAAAGGVADLLDRLPPAALEGRPGAG